MPNRDGTGPTGSGSGTGRGAGPCGSGDPGYRRFWGRGRGRGLGGGFRSGFGQAVTPDQERSWLEAQAQNLQNTLRNINDRLANMKK